MVRSKKTGIIGIIVTAVVLIVLVILTNIDVGKFSYIESAFNSLVMPVQNGITFLKNKITGNKTFFTDINNLRQENETLKTKNSELEKSLRELEIIKAENETLKQYVNLKDKYAQFTTIPAYVINRDISNYSNIIVINIGKKDGIDVNMTVISDEGLVGHIISVTDSTAKVQTIMDTSSSVSSTISTSRDSIIVKGTLDDASMLKATYIPTDATLLQGDNIETSGLGGIYQKGIHIGAIRQIISTRNITDRYAMVEPAVNFKKLETVLVITQ